MEGVVGRPRCECALSKLCWQGAEPGNCKHRAGPCNPMKHHPREPSNRSCLIQFMLDGVRMMAKTLLSFCIIWPADIPSRLDLYNGDTLSSKSLMQQNYPHMADTWAKIQDSTQAVTMTSGELSGWLDSSIALPLHTSAPVISLQTLCARWFYTHSVACTLTQMWNVTPT